MHQILQAAAQPIDGPCRDHVDLFPGNRLEQFVEARAAITALGTADALVFEHGHHLPAVALGDGLQLAFLVLDGLLVGRDPDVQGDPAVSLGIHGGCFFLRRSVGGTVKSAKIGTDVAA